MIGHLATSRVTMEFKHAVDSVVIRHRSMEEGLPCIGDVDETLLCTHDPCPGT